MVACFRFVAVLLTVLSGGLHAASQQLDPLFENPVVQEINRLPMRTAYFPFETKERAAANDPAQSQRFLSLNGTWRFQWVNRPELLAKDFFKPEFTETGWIDFPVPANWEFKGFGVPIYVNHPYEFAMRNPNPPDIPDANDQPAAGYRKTAAFVGHYKSAIKDQYYPYVRPQESGNKTDVRWARLLRKDGTGVLIAAADSLLSISALPYSREHLDSGPQKQQQHSGELEPTGRVYLQVDLRQMGVGGIDSWGSLPLPAYRLSYQDYKYSYWVVPVTKTEKR
jgi:hypothetical protein